MTEIQTTGARDYIAEFRQAFSAGIESICKAGKIYVEAIEENPKLAETFREEFADTIPAQAWSGLEAVGRKWMHPRLLMGGGGRYARQIKRLPYSLQERIFSGQRFPLVLDGGDKLLVAVRQVTKEQAEQLFDGSTIRSPASQRAWLDNRKIEPRPADAEVLPYTITGGQVVFRRSVRLTRVELRRILAEM